MKHIAALLIKFFFIEAILFLVFMTMTDATFGQTMFVGFLLTLLLYFLGDMVILPSMGNMSAVVADSGIVLLALWLAPMYTGIDRVTFTDALWPALAIGVAEYFYHNYLIKAILPGPVIGSTS